VSKRAKQFWLRQHSTSEKRFADALTVFLKDQAERIADAFSQSHRFQGYASRLGELLHDSFNAQAEHRRFMGVASTWLLRLMALGAQMENASHKATRLIVKAPVAAPADEPPEDDDSIFAPIILDPHIEVPPAALARIRNELLQVESQPYWKHVSKTTEGRIATVITNGIEAGLSQREIVSAIRERLSDQAKDRALLIARTETTGALNAGHYAMRQELIDSGHIKTEQWLAVLDGDTRDTHAALDGAEIVAGEMFNVGGESAPYPGWYGLSASERANCRCTTVAGATFAE